MDQKSLDFQNNNPEFKLASESKPNGLNTHEKRKILKIFSLDQKSLDFQNNNPEFKLASETKPTGLNSHEKRKILNIFSLDQKSLDFQNNNPEFKLASESKPNGLNTHEKRKILKIFSLDQKSLDFQNNNPEFKLATESEPTGLNSHEKRKILKIFSLDQKSLDFQNNNPEFKLATESEPNGLNTHEKRKILKIFSLDQKSLDFQNNNPEFKLATESEPTGLNSHEKRKILKIFSLDQNSLDFQNNNPELEPANEKEATDPNNQVKRDVYLKRIAARHVWGDQTNDSIPPISNYTTCELFFCPNYKIGSVMPFGDLRGHRFDNKTYAMNAGIGGRYIPDPKNDFFCGILGFNAYYDYRQGSIGHYNQFGLGIEILTNRWGFRGNAYIPFGKKSYVNIYNFNDYIGDYWGILRDTESINYSFNIEVGYLAFLSKNFFLYVAGGPYYIGSGPYSSPSPGGEIRICPQYKDYLSLDLSWQYDNLFKTTWQAQLTFTIPLYQLSSGNSYPCKLSDRQIYQRVERFEVAPLRDRECWNCNWDDGN